MSKKVYAVFGGGMQGKAAAFDLGMFGNAKQILIFDKNEHLAQQACDYVNHLLPKNLCHAVEHDLNGRPDNAAEIVELLEICDACISCLPYHMNLLLGKCCIKAGCHFNNLGGNTSFVEAELEMHDEAKEASVSVVPDCGLAPGTNNIFAASLVAKGMKYISMYCGGLPINQDLPLGYKKTFAIGGLINEYCGYAVYLKGGKITEIPALDKINTMFFPVENGDDFVKMEAAPTSGGTSTAPKSFLGQVEEYTYHTLRYAESGHFDFFRNLKKLGMLDLVSDRLKEVLDFPGERDRVTLIVEGGRTGDQRDVVMEVHCDADENFTAMEQMTGFSAAIVTIMQADGKVLAGAVPLELSVDHKHFIEEFKKRFPQLTIDEKK